MFNRKKVEGKRVIKVISVKNEVRETEVKEEASRYAYDLSRSVDKTTTEKHNVTIVLVSINGELRTREFNGNWDLSDIKSWEDL